MRKEKMLKFFKTAFCIAFFALCIWLIVTGQKNIGPPGLLTMLAGLAGLILLLYFYNRRYSKR